MKKILSIILTLTMLAVPFVVQCSAAECSYGSCGNSYMGISAEQNTSSDKKDEKGFFSKVGSFFTFKKMLLIATGAIVALCIWSPNGEAGAAARDFYDNTLVPGAKSFYNYAAEKTTEYWNSAKDWTSNICVQPNTPCSPNHYGSACDKNAGDCEKTLGRWFSDWENWASEKWNKFNDLCIINGQDEKCQMAVKDVFGKAAAFSNGVITTVESNIAAWKSNSGICPAPDIINDNFNGTSPIIAGSRDSKK